ncbi:SAM-dependent methyltransferase [Mycobacterium sp. M26]|uniref:class I SAM-dependent methyltransferase n=1 Tax=Mycobacterium sp. M26 TaxID=1762962 RepID=UPI001E3A5829|nr:SAM-dependent methyltransferase [Mycobacterium sp. M26]
MSDRESLVSGVSDTARWVAVYRAQESARPDALFRDDLADLLAGEQGRAIVAAAPRRIRDGWWLVARTKLIDDLIEDAIAQGCDRVLNLAAGLDTRPYRLDLPADLVWVEADLPALVAEKDRLLADRTPRCQLSRHAVDLADPAARDRFLDEALAGARKAFVLTEGLLMYLSAQDVTGLSAAFTRPEIAWWTFDFASRGLQKTMNEKADGLLRNAPFTFAPDNGLAFFEDLGWTTVSVESVMTAAYRYRRLPRLMRLLARLPQPDPRRPGTKVLSAVACMTR